MFAQILLVFKFTFANVEYSLALVQPYNEPIAPRNRPKKDRDLRVRSAARTPSDFIDIGYRHVLTSARFSKILFHSVDNHLQLSLKS